MVNGITLLGAGQYHVPLSAALLSAKISAPETGPTNNAKYQLMGDAATVLNAPRLWTEIALTDANGAPVTTLQRGQTITFTGTVTESPGGSALPFEGVASVLIEDSAPLAATGAIPCTYYSVDFRYEAGTIYHGDVSIANGQFEGRFVVPMDATLGASGRVRSYISGTSGAGTSWLDGSGALATTLATGSAGTSDTEPPRITLGFVGGSTAVRPDATLRADIFDVSGVMTTGHALQNSIVVTIDDKHHVARGHHFVVPVRGRLLPAGHGDLPAAGAHARAPQDPRQRGGQPGHGHHRVPAPLQRRSSSTWLNSQAGHHARLRVPQPAVLVGRGGGGHVRGGRAGRLGQHAHQGLHGQRQADPHAVHPGRAWPGPDSVGRPGRRGRSPRQRHLPVPRIRQRPGGRWKQQRGPEGLFAGPHRRPEPLTGGRVHPLLAPGGGRKVELHGLEQCAVSAYQKNPARRGLCLPEEYSMRLPYSLLLTVLLVSCLATSALAQGTGRSLDIQPGARQNGMGAAGVALDEDATGVTWWNPAGLGFVNKSAVEVTYAQLVPGLANDVSYNFATYVHPMSGGGAWGVGLVFLSYGTSDRTNESGTVLGQFGSNEVSPALYYGLKLLPEMTWSLAQVHPHPARAGRPVGRRLHVRSRRGRALPHSGRAAASGHEPAERGPGVTFLNEDQKSPLSRNLKMGMAWQAMTGKEFQLLTVADFNQSLVTNKFRTFNVSLEIQYTDQIAGRIGYYSDPLGEIKDLTYGLGISWKALSMDYASIPQARGLRPAEREQDHAGLPLLIELVRSNSLSTRVVLFLAAAALALSAGAAAAHEALSVRRVQPADGRARAGVPAPHDSRRTRRRWNCTEAAAP